MRPKVGTFPHFLLILATETGIIFGTGLLLKWQPWLGTLLHLTS